MGRGGRISCVLMSFLLGFAVSACTPAGQPQAWDTAAEFQDAVSHRDGAGACHLLSDEARHRLESASARTCPAALAAVSLPGGPVRSIETWGGNSQVRLDGAVLFLAEFDVGWRITAAGCTPRPDRPYDCIVAA